VENACRAFVESPELFFVSVDGASKFRTQVTFSELICFIRAIQNIPGTAPFEIKSAILCQGSSL
jgi:hypothetical protein